MVVGLVASVCVCLSSLGSNFWKP